MTGINDATFLGFALIGFVLGLRHATDADHVVAVTTIVSREARLRAAMKIGMAWGLGHTTTILAAGGTILTFKLRLSSSFDVVAEAVVGLVLIGLGVGTIATRWRGRRAGAGELAAHWHGHWHGGRFHSHSHAHAPGDFDSHDDHKLAQGRRLSPGSGVTAFAVGLVHGLAGSAAITLLVLGAIPRPVWGVFYLLMFGVGTLAGMMAIAMLIAVPGIVTAGRFARANDFLRLGSGGVSVALGLLMVKPLLVP